MTEITAAGFDKQEPHDADSQLTQGSVVYDNGQYRLLMKRVLTTEDAGTDIQFEMAKFIPVVFSACDGGNGEEGLKRAISTWYYIYLEPPASREPYLYAPIAAFLAVGFQMFLRRKVLNNRG